MVEFDVGVILPTAGCSERISSNIPKQYTRVLGKPLFLYALEEFIALKFIKRIALVVDNIERATNFIQESRVSGSQKIVLVSGGNSRHRSIKAGLQELQKPHQDSEIKVVIIHDGVRPIIASDCICDLILEADKYGAAGFTRPLVSTVVKPSADSTLELTLNRNAYSASETPQAFKFDVLNSAYSKCSQDDFDHGTECLQLVLEYCGIKAKLIPGPDELWKVTHKKDFYTAAACLREKSIDVCIISDKETEAVSLLVEALTDKVASLERVVGTGKPKLEDPGKTFNTVILFHVHEIQQDQHLLDFATLLNLEKQGLIIHVIDHASVDGLQSMSVYNLHRNSCKMAHNYVKLHKGVVVIHCVSSNELQKLVDIVSSLVQSDPLTFSGQTLFL